MLLLFNQEQRLLKVMGMCLCVLFLCCSSSFLICYFFSCLYFSEITSIYGDNGDESYQLSSFFKDCSFYLKDNDILPNPSNFCNQSFFEKNYKKIMKLGKCLSFFRHRKKHLSCFVLYVSLFILNSSSSSLLFHKFLHIDFFRIF